MPSVNSQLSMDIYSRNSRWKLYLAVAGVLIVLISMVYTSYLTNNLAKDERQRVKLWENAIETIRAIDEEEVNYCDYTLHTSVIQSNRNIPVILVDDRGAIVDAANNFGEGLDSLTDARKEQLKKEVQQPEEEGFQTIQGAAFSIYYKESKILTQLRYFPIFQLLLIGAFIFFGYLAFNSARRAEQNRVWVGMAKETAHQLGTPITAIMAWLEHLKTLREDDTEVTEIVTELGKDINRLELIADRFSKIGSAPNLETINVYDELYKCFSYMRRRAPRKVEFEPPIRSPKPLFININPHLFDWVIENLIRNALDAMEGKGKISSEISEDKGSILIDLKDTGKGIPPGKFKTVFRPGFTTKKRGWGLGLSLAKRIIEEYHSGKIFVKKSVENEGTTFTIKLPKSINPKATTNSIENQQLIAKKS